MFAAFPEPGPIVKGLLNRHDKGILSGLNKSGKSFALLDLAISCSAGERWLAWGTCHTPVAYISLQVQRPFLCQRVEAIRRAKGMPPGNLSVWSIQGMEGATLTEKILSQVQPGVGLIAIDAIDSAFRYDFRQVDRALDQMISATGAAVMCEVGLVACGKRLGQAADCHIALAPEATPNHYTMSINLRHLPPVACKTVEWVAPIFVERE